MIVHVLPATTNTSRPPPEGTLMIAGPIGCGKSTFAFQYACNLAVMEPCRNVIFVCSKRKIQCDPVMDFHVDGVPRKQRIGLKRVHVHYLETVADVHRLLANVHLMEELPCGIVVDDIHTMIANNRHATDSLSPDYLFTKTLACLNNALETIHPTSKQRITYAAITNTLHDMFHTDADNSTPRFKFHGHISEYLQIAHTGDDQNPWELRLEGSRDVLRFRVHNNTIQGYTRATDDVPRTLPTHVEHSALPP